MNRTVLTLLMPALLIVASGCGDSDARDDDRTATPIDKTAATVELLPIPPTGDSREAWLILREADVERARWRVGAIWAADWSGVAVNHVSEGNDRAWWISWYAGGGTGLAEYIGAVVWIDANGRPAYWCGTWRRTESSLGPRAYEYKYVTTLELAGESPKVVRLRVRVQGKDPDAGEIDTLFTCIPELAPDGEWHMVVQDEDRQNVERLLDVDTLSGIHAWLRELLSS